MYAELDCVQTELYEIGQRFEETSLVTERKGAIVFKYIRCGKQYCHCMKGGRPHGPYPHLQWWEKGKIKTKYLNKKNYPTILKELLISKEIKNLKKRQKELLKTERKLKRELKALEGALV